MYIVVSLGFGPSLYKRERERERERERDFPSLLTSTAFK
jgi:hypothetical protein